VSCLIYCAAKTTTGVPVKSRDETDGPSHRDFVDAVEVSSSRSTSSSSSGYSGIHEKADILVGLASVSGELTSESMF